MKNLCFVICSILIFATCASGQANPSHSSGKTAGPLYQSAWLVKLTAQVHTETDQAFFTTMLDTTIVSEKIVTYGFLVRTGTVQYRSRYTPAPANQPGKLPAAWWQGDALVGIRVKKQKLYLRLPGGGEVASHIVSQTAVAQ